MFRVLTCLTGEHDLRLVVLAGFICFIASLVAISLFHRATAAQDRVRYWWVVLAGAATGSGIWATHFIAMLAYEPGVSVGYNVALTALSLAAAALVSAIGFAIAIRRDSMESAGIGGGVIGAGIASMHYLGMWALEVPGHAEWQADLVGASILLGMAFGAGALMCARDDLSLRGRLFAATLLTLAIVSHHFTAMGAVEIVPDPTRAIDALSFSPMALAFIVAGLTAVILATGIVAAMIDQRFRDKSIRLETTLDSMIQGIAMYDMESRLVLCNRRYGEMYKLPPEALVPGTPLVELMRHRVKAGTFDRDPETYVAAVLKTVPDGRTKLVNVPDGRIMSVTNRPMPNGGWVTTHEDITQRSKAEAKVRHMARHDGLTNLPNRGAFEELMQLAIAQDGANALHAVLCLDLDRFKNVNDMLGHAIGDGVLVAVTRRLRHALRESDVVSRFGGDEFAILQTGIDTREDASALAQRIIDAIAAPFEIDGHQVVIGTSVGIAVAPDHGDAPSHLLRNADMALYRAKANGRGTFAFFETGMDEQIK